MLKQTKALVRRLLPTRMEQWATRIVRSTEIALRVYYFKVRNRISEQRLQDSPDKPIVSLTTFPARLGSVSLAIESIFRQSAPPGAVYLWLYEGEISKDEFPEALQRLEQRGLRIEFVPENLRGAKKLIYAAKQFPDRIIVTADDDLLYPWDWLERLECASRETPGTVICHRGHKIERRHDGTFHRYWDCMRVEKGGTDPSLALLPTGGAGSLYPPGVLNQQIFNIDLMLRLCPTADDVWFKAMTLLNGVKCRRAAERNFMPIVIPGSQEQALIHHNKHANDTQIETTFSHFDLNECFPRTGR